MTIRKSTYQAAEKVAVTIEEHFAKYKSQEASEDTERFAPVPEARIIETILDTAFWASLRREESYSPKISMALLPPEKAGNPLLFHHRQRFSSEVLTKISSGVERPGIHLGVWHEEDALYIWGTTRDIPDNCFVVDVSEPGMIVIKHRRIHGFGKFANVAVLSGDQVKIIDSDMSTLPDCPELVTSLLSSTSNYDYTLNILIQLSVSMRAHKKGGILLIVPEGTEKWKSSIVQPMRYALNPAYTGLAELMNRDISERGNTLWQNAVSKEIESIAGLTAVDGATILNNKYELIAFGAKIKLADGDNQIENVMTIEPILGGENKIINPSHNRGTRHLSAAQFIQDQHDALALVASQDGSFTVLSWSETDKIVQAYRIDSMLL